jgi:hypothetical protein
VVVHIVNIEIDFVLVPLVHYPLESFWISMFRRLLIRFVLLNVNCVEDQILLAAFKSLLEKLIQLMNVHVVFVAEANELDPDAHFTIVLLLTRQFHLISINYHD